MSGVVQLVAGAAVAFTCSAAAMGLEASLGLVRLRWVGFQPSARRHAVMAIFVLATVAVEEIYFRFFVLGALASRIDADAAVVLSALIFGASHAFGSRSGERWRDVASATCAGVLLGYCFLLTRSLPLVIGFHFAWNLSITLLGYASSPLASVSSRLFVVGPLGTRFSCPSWLAGRDATHAIHGLRMGLVALAAVTLRFILGADSLP